VRSTSSSKIADVMIIRRSMYDVNLQSAGSDPKTLVLE
jgi:hypothetical protein